MRLIRDKSGNPTGVAYKDEQEQEDSSEIARFLGRSMKQFLVPGDSVVVDRARVERLLNIARIFTEIEDSPGMDGDERWAWMSMEAGTLRPGDLDPLP